MPTLWLYAENDSFFRGDYVRKLHEAYVAKGGRAEFHMFEPIGKDGHDIIANVDGMLHWLPAMDSFLRANQLATYDPAPLVAAVTVLNLTAPGRRCRPLSRPPDREGARHVAVQSVRLAHAAGRHRGGGSNALEGCEERAKEPCRIVMRNFEVVKDPVVPH